jgi:hypothetical protein
VKTASAQKLELQASGGARPDLAVPGTARSTRWESAWMTCAEFLGWRRSAGLGSPWWRAACEVTAQGPGHFCPLPKDCQPGAEEETSCRLQQHFLAVRQQEPIAAGEVSASGVTVAAIQMDSKPQATDRSRRDAAGPADCPRSVLKKAGARRGKRAPVDEFGSFLLFSESFVRQRAMRRKMSKSIAPRALRLAAGDGAKRLMGFSFRARA